MATAIPGYSIPGMYPPGTVLFGRRVGSKRMIYNDCSEPYGRPK